MMYLSSDALGGGGGLGGRRCALCIVLLLLHFARLRKDEGRLLFSVARRDVGLMCWPGIDVSSDAKAICPGKPQYWALKDQHSHRQVHTPLC